MKKIAIALFTLITLSAQAQENVLLSQSFWQGKPVVSQVKTEIEKGNSPAQLNQNSFDPVVLAILAQAPSETIKYLIEQPGNDVSKLTHDSRVYLHWAAYKGNVEIMEHVLGKGAKASPVDSHGATPLNFAAGGGVEDTRVYDLLIKHGANLKKDLNHDGANALLLAVATDKDLKLTDYFVSKGLDITSTDASGNNAFSYAARSGNIGTLKALQQRSVPVNQTALIMAGQGTRQGPAPADAFQYLESVGVKPTATNKNGENVLHALARRSGHIDLIQHFLSQGVDINQVDEEGNTPFMNAAASNRDLPTLELLLPKVKNINRPNAKGVTALAMAVRGNSPGVVRLLLDKGALVSAVDTDGNTLGNYLVQGYRNTGPGVADFDHKMTMLQQKGLDLKAPQSGGNTLYHLAIAKNDLALVKKIEPLQIDINARNREGVTALHKAAMIARDDTLMKYLLSIGAKKDVATNFDETAYDLATENETLVKNNVSVNFLK